MPTAEELGAQFERFLAEQQGRTDSAGLLTPLPGGLPLPGGPP